MGSSFGTKHPRGLRNTGELHSYGSLSVKGTITFPMFILFSLRKSERFHSSSFSNRSAKTNTCEEVLELPHGETVITLSHTSRLRRNSSFAPSASSAFTQKKVSTPFALLQRHGRLQRYVLRSDNLIVHADEHDENRFGYHLFQHSREGGVREYNMLTVVFSMPS